MSRRLPRRSKRRRPDMFLSHSSVDEVFARRLVEHLDSLGIDVWLAEWDLDAGDRLRESIADAIERSRFFGVVVSSAFEKSDWCQRELRYALKKERQAKKRILVPIVLESGDLPKWAAERVFLRFDHDYYTGLANLAGMIHRIPRRRIHEETKQRRLRTAQGVGTMLRELGWGGAGLLDAEDFDQLATMAGVVRRGNTIEFIPDNVKARNPGLSPRLRRILNRAKWEP